MNTFLKFKCVSGLWYVQWTSLLPLYFLTTTFVINLPNKIDPIVYTYAADDLLLYLYLVLQAFISFLNYSFKLSLYKYSMYKSIPDYLTHTVKIILEWRLHFISYLKNVLGFCFFLCEFYLDRISSTPYQYFSRNMNLKELLMSFSPIIHDLKRKTMPLAPTYNEFG